VLLLHCVLISSVPRLILAYSMLFGWCHTGTNNQCYNQATKRGYSDLWFCVVSYNRPAMWKNEPVYYSSVNVGLISSLETLFAYIAQVTNLITWRQPFWTQDIS